MSIEKLPSGKWRAVVQHKGKKATSRAVPTRAEARTLEAHLTLNLGAKPKDGGHSVGEVVDGYIADGAGRLSPRTIVSYREGAGALPETFKARDVSGVSVLILDGLYSELRRDGMSEHKIAKAHKLLSASFTRAARYGWVMANPCKDAEKPKPVIKEINPPSFEQVGEIIAASEKVNPDLPSYLRVLSVTGMRRGEACGLRWEDWDFESNRVFVRRNLVENGREIVIRETKTGNKGKRRISVDKVTMGAMQALRARQATQADEHEMPAPVWCFSHDTGHEPWRPEYVTRAMGRLSDEFTLHDLRHFHATQLLANGTSVVNVSMRLGHSTSTLTLNTYAHWIPQQDQDAADMMGGLLDGVVLNTLDGGKTESPLS